MAIRPPRRQTRVNSAATLSGRGANMAPNMETTVSKVASPYGNCSASPSSNWIASPSATARARLFQ
jgi:hypothetical protein